jgi:hypothetical protein
MVPPTQQTCATASLLCIIRYTMCVRPEVPLPPPVPLLRRTTGSVGRPMAGFPHWSGGRGRTGESKEMASGVMLGAFSYAGKRDGSEWRFQGYYTLLNPFG